mmetsp:Transcript_27196/g.51781  ORF Transcript_27196/g.51781 Transcript_27196/m.51781 type:complete len:286 (-) Transcript_27196:89-946(-)
MTNSPFSWRSKIKEILAGGAAYQGTLTQFSKGYELRYDIGKELPKIPQAVTDARNELGWKACKIEFCCEGTCSIAMLGMKDEPVVWIVDVKDGNAARVLIMSLDKPELGITVGHLDVRREELTAGDETWWIGMEPVIRATRVASKSEMRSMLAQKRLGLVEGAVYSGKCAHPFFKAYEVVYEFGKVLPQPPEAVLQARRSLGWPEDAEVCCKGWQSIIEFGAKQCEVVIMADMKLGERRLLVVPTEKPELGVTVARLSDDLKELAGGEAGWWTDQEPMFVGAKIR